jgi:hypothetical protein
MKGRQMIELIRARCGLPNPRAFNNNQGQNQFRPRMWRGRPQQNQQRPQQQQQRPVYNSTNALQPMYNNIQVPMDLSHTRTPYNRRQSQNNNAYTNTIQTEFGNTANVPIQQDYQRRRPKGPCFNCGKVSHFAKDCRSNPSANINYMDTINNNMQYVPQPNITPHSNIVHLKAQIDALFTKDNDALIEAPKLLSWRRSVKLPRGLRVRLERFQVMAIVWERCKMLPAELR